jgi:hypothetical protein
MGCSHGTPHRCFLHPMGSFTCKACGLKANDSAARHMAFDLSAKQMPYRCSAIGGSLAAAKGHSIGYLLVVRHCKASHRCTHLHRAVSRL